MARSRGPRVVEVAVHSLDAEGFGVAAFADRDVKVVKLKGVAAGAHVRARIVKRRRGVWLGLPESGASTTACTAFPACGGCAIQHLDPDVQLEMKSRTLMNLFREHAVAVADVPAPCRGPLFGYRRRARLGVRHLKATDETLIGFREAFGSRVARADVCPVLVASLQRVVAALRGRLPGMDARADIPQVELAAGDAAAAFIVRHLKPLTATDRRILEEVAADVGAQVLTQSAGYESVRDLDGGPARQLSYKLPRRGLAFEFAPIDFVQVNPVINELLVEEAVGELVDTGRARVVDLFCGIGNFSLACARSGADVVGVEGDAALVARARGNATRNGLTGRTEFVTADLYADSTPAVSDALGWCDRVLIDPPRSGAGAALRGIGASQISKVVYVSCHPQSLAADAAVLVQNGFILAKVRLFDMFPHTNHVEVLGVFERS